MQTIVTSQAYDDPGLFENQIHYQITDPRYLPFEGASAISDWHLELGSTNEIDLSTVSDVLVHLLYTSIDGGPDFKQEAINSLAASQQYTTKLFSAVNDFSARRHGSQSLSAHPLAGFPGHADRRCRPGAEPRDQRVEIPRLDPRPDDYHHRGHRLRSLLDRGILRARAPTTSCDKR